MTLIEYIREFVCQIEHFTDYIEDAVECPELVDFDVIRGKIEMVRRHMSGVERQLGIGRKEGKDESGASSSTRKAQQGKEGPRKTRARPDPRSAQTSRTQSGASRQGGGAGRKR